MLAALPMVADGSDPGYALELLAMFETATTQALQHIAQASAAADAPRLQRLVHTLKSSGASVGALALAVLAGEAEEALRRGTPVAADLPAQLGAAWQQLQPELARHRATAAAPNPVPRLLLVDDDSMLRHMAARTLRHAGFEVVDAPDGEAGLAAFAAQDFDLVLLDVMLPGLDGFEVCQRLRVLPRGARVPVLMLTGLNDTGSIDQAYSQGATDFITKPINWTLLSHRVRYALRAADSADTLRLGRERLARAQRLAGMGSWAFTAAGGLECSPELARLYGAAVSDERPWITTAGHLLQRVLPTDRDAVALARRRLRDEGCAYQIEFRIERLDGQLRTLHEQAMPLLDDSGRRVAIEGITQDITERVQAAQRIRQLAHYDAVTGLPNRQFFGELAAPALDRARRQGLHCAVLHVDLDEFKAVNDAYGRGGGDHVLQVVAERLRGWIRGTDLAGVPSLVPAASDADDDSGASGSAGVVARVGGNAFTLLIADLAGQGSAAAVAQRLLGAVHQPITLPGPEAQPPLVLSAGIGIALYPGDAPDPAGLTRCAEQAAYAAKARGRGQLRFFDETIDAQATRRLRVETELRHAIEHGELRLHYQPKLVFDDDGGHGPLPVGRLAGAEALVRWQHPERGLVPPGEFIAVAEEAGLIGPLTDWVLDHACRQLAAWRAAGLALVPLAVNLAATSFADATLADRLSALLQRHGLPPASLVLEVTESLLMREPEATAGRMAALRARGFALSLDDFGTGYSSLSYLKRFPLDELKIDRSFVVDAARGGRDSALAKAIIGLGRDLGLRVVAEGVETAEQAAFLRRHGCLVHQGYLYARPLPAEAFAQGLAREAPLP
ncbi:EAL domain-containing protein [Aquabacterium sp. OR-4]|uniref:EAL domain-containing protein n=1 Tax=Aquabacterium sp. OR-4 TaxID=2978127 RepID=UPI0028C702C3|nr:EAL domain-containing protein [Aquabacterium sp. OR-4]MDT7833836.1 EAL domain-containing protein [Aquabacterium sp. OR-4]